MILALHGKSSFCLKSSLLNIYNRGGMKESGIGRENGVEAFNACASQFYSLCAIRNLHPLVDSQTKSTIVNFAPAEEMRSSDDWFSDSPEGKRYG
jgi:hypothetical protein